MRREKAAVACVVAAVGVVIGLGTWADRAGNGPAPRRPSSVNEVLARVPARAFDLVAGTRARLRQRLRAGGEDLAAATELARLEIEAARTSGDPRFLGHAEAALAAWWDAERPPPPVLLLRATIRQARHEFDGALADLDRLLEDPPDQLTTQAWLTRAVVLGVLGRYAPAVESCDRLAGRASAFVVAACRAPLLGLTGRARLAARELSAALIDASSRDEQAWGLSLLGELARWTGDDRAAEAHLRASLAWRPDDRYTRGVLAELLVDAGRSAEAKAFATAVSEGAPPAGASGDQTRLALARQHWRLQREPADARLLLEAAAATGDRAAAAPVLAWLEETGFEWPRLRRLADALRGVNEPPRVQ